VPRPEADFEAFRDQLVDLFHSGASYDSLRIWLQEHEISVTSRTIQRRFAQWGVRKRNPPVEVSDDIQQRVWDLFFQLGLNDDEILQVLHNEGFMITKKSLRTIRVQLGLKRRLDDPVERARALNAAKRLLQHEIQSGSPIVERFGYRFVRSFLQQKNHHFSIHIIAKACRTVCPDAVERRRSDLQRQRGEYIVPGPNYIWSIDGYDKLKPYGIEIYACIDAYARCIMWIYVGVSNHTQVSAVRQYLDTVEQSGFQPYIVRSDRGSETPMLANAHWQLRLGTDPSVRFEDCYLYGTSSANQRIESWWGQLSKNNIFLYRVSISYG
jgi:hypothetical protein